MEACNYWRKFQFCGPTRKRSPNDPSCNWPIEQKGHNAHPYPHCAPHTWPIFSVYSRYHVGRDDCERWALPLAKTLKATASSTPHTQRETARHFGTLLRGRTNCFLLSPFLWLLGCYRTYTGSLPLQLYLPSSAEMLL